MLRKISGYLLIVIVFFITIIAILGVWEVIDLDRVLRKSVLSLVITFISSVIILFVFSVVIKIDENKKVDS